ncbi:MAG: hypothetical protein M0Z92_14570 [Actinomycetota bacterium]|nr:hypothetical protein [Actinomycetota bacterium]
MTDRCADLAVDFEEATLEADERVVNRIHEFAVSETRCKLASAVAMAA